ncbi:MAG: hypothetical protein K6F71_00515 [Ruminococcus sp.]|uniref:hypothetical protein n=1 Tax=Ruminococcus sp. TaxID=41978 RepID=UPI0025ED87C7|nr:hypothetical protein [Ruminococcus sp.]MCR5539306.1 hypothetical protein [Ruminococcus sp.]
MDSIFGIKAERFTAAVAKTIREYENVSMSEIKSRVDAGEYVYSCKYVDGKGIRNILEIKDKLAKAGINCELLKNGEPISEEYMHNTLESFKITEEWTEYVMDMEAQAEENS